MSANTAITRLSLLLTVCFLAACGSATESMISKKWKTTNIENSSIKKKKKEYIQLLDTITARNAGVAAYGTVDALKKAMLLGIEEAEQRMKTNMENSFMEFKKNHVVYFISVDGIDSAKWSLEDNEIVCDPEEFTGTQELTRLRISQLTKDSMTLKMINQYDTSIISLKSTTN